MPRNIVIGQNVNSEKVRSAKELRSGQTKAESVLWQALRANRLNGFHFRRQQIIRGFIVDFYCHQVRLVVEVDGPVHDDQLEQDAARDVALSELGLRVVRFSNLQVMEDLPTVVGILQGALKPFGEVRG